MLNRIRARLTYANVMATIAAFMVVTGIGYAVAALPKKSVGPKQLKNGAVRSKKIKRNAVNGSKIRKGAVGRSELATGAVGSGKISNRAVITKKLADGSVTRVKVDPKAIPFLGVLNSGDTLRGTFNLGGEVTTDRDNQTFQFPLNNAPAAPAANVIDATGPTPAFTSNCSGIGGGNAQTPNAAPGHLCVYITFQAGTTPALAIDAGALTRLGFGLTGSWGTAADANQIRGQWAVTAP